MIGVCPAPPRSRCRTSPTWRPSRGGSSRPGSSAGSSASSAGGLRPHILVALGAALFVLAGREASFTSADTSRVVQGIITGVGFLGAGTILKLVDKDVVHGLTTAATIWVTAGVGVASVLAPLWLAGF